MAPPNPPPEDSWAFQPIGSPFPENPVKALGQQNMYVALWYKHGKPIHGRAWNNGGVVECSFPYGKYELTGARDLGGQIQVLQYKGDHRSLGYWYNWIKYKDRKEKEDRRQSVRCGDSFPILWYNRPEGALLGYLDIAKEVAYFSHDGKADQLSGSDLDELLLIVRELDGAPPTCECPECEAKRKKRPVVRVMHHEWADVNFGDPFPTRNLVKALGRSLNTVAGEKPEQYVALWYQSGEPVMGRVWNENGKIAASFSWGGHDYRKQLGSIQLLCELPDAVRGFDYGWRPFPEAAKFGDKEWHPVHVNHYKGDIGSGVLIIDGKEVLGKIDVRNERATVGLGGTEKIYVGPAVHQFLVLCRKAKPGCKFD